MNSVVITAPTSEQNGKQAQRKPGRPPKQKYMNVLIQTHGIVNNPIESDTLIEVIYENPTLFGKIFSMHKAYATNEIILSFDENLIQFSSVDIKNITRIYTKIYGRMMIRYFCSAPMICCVKREDLENIFKTLDKNHSQVKFVIKESDAKSRIYIEIHDSSVDMDITYPVELCCIPEWYRPYDFNENIDYPLHFSLPSKNFKKIISDVSFKKDVKFITWSKYSDNLLRHSYNDKNMKSDPFSVYNESEKIGLRTSLKNGELFTVSVNIAQIKPFANTGLADYIMFSAHNSQDFCMEIEVDRKKYSQENGIIVDGPVCSIKVFTNIVKN